MCSKCEYTCIVCWYLWSADHVLPRYRQRGDVHGDAAIHVERPDQEETATSNYRSAERHRRVYFNKVFLFSSVLLVNFTFITLLHAKLSTFMLS